MSNQTLVHNMRCQNFSGGELEIRKKALPLLIQVGYILYLHKRETKQLKHSAALHVVMKTSS